MENYSADKAKEELNRLVEEVKQERDEMIVKAHLLKADAKDELAKVDKQWEHFKAKSAQVGREAKDASGDVTAAVKLLGEEIINSIKRIRRSL
ncbi:hypothetical protein [Aliiglaciecola sp. LCG003]|uniref:hypothetical protein n=1 Tax=Aliiglaciecola sp. LCG003 TaxID=3053655 RepID=UPI002572264E|nr:hypothetical protein [Aliiglaciecola sp. LCG003]WJG07678.1 hypothetical protein QR722_09875 [Aliiglaciecola sp. LCG003]